MTFHSICQPRNKTEWFDDQTRPLPLPFSLGKKKRQILFLARMHVHLSSFLSTEEKKKRCLHIEHRAGHIWSRFLFLNTLQNAFALAYISRAFAHLIILYFFLLFWLENCLWNRLLKLIYLEWHAFIETVAFDFFKERERVSNK